MKKIFLVIFLLFSSNVFAGKTLEYSCSQLKQIVQDAGAEGVEFTDTVFGMKSSRMVYSSFALAKNACAVDNWAAYCEGKATHIRSADKRYCFIGWVPYYDYASER